MTNQQLAAMEQALEALVYTEYRLKQSRVWGGMEWSYHPVHPHRYLPIADNAKAAADNLRTVIEQAKRQQALDKMAENARELGLDYEPPCKTGSQCTNKCQQCEQLAIKQDLTPEPAQQESVADVGLLEYKGNSVAYIHQKMKAYRNGIDAAWDAMRAKGFHPDGKTSLADMIAKHTSSQPSKPRVGLTDEETGHWAADFLAGAKWAEAKLKEKNNG